MAEGAGLWSKIIGTAQIVLGVRWPLADSQETISPLVMEISVDIVSASLNLFTELFAIDLTLTKLRLWKAPEISILLFDLYEVDFCNFIVRKKRHRVPGVQH